MEPINVRIAKVIDSKYNKNKSAFARDIGITPAYAAQLYAGQRDPSDRTIADICRVCGVDEIWLRTGTGDMDAPKTRREELEEIFHHCEIGTDAKARMIRAMAQLPDDAFPVFLKYLQELAKTLSEE